MRWRSLLPITLGCLLIACGRRDPGSLVNNTDDTLRVVLRLNRPPLPHCPDNYFRLSLLNGDSIGGLRLVSLDTAFDLATLDILPRATVPLGTVRGDADREDHRSWEFSEIRASGNRFMLAAADTGLMTFIAERSHWFQQDEYAFVIGVE